MNLQTKVMDPGKSLPAELTAMYRGSSNFARDRMFRNADHVQQRGGAVGNGNGMGAVDWKAIAQMTKDAAQVTIPIMVAQNPGTLYKYDEKTGQIMVYSQPEGSQQNLPINTGGYGSGGAFQANTAFGDVSAAGIDTNTMLLIGVAGLAVIMMMGQRGGR